MAKPCSDLRGRHEEEAEGYGINWYKRHILSLNIVVVLAIISTADAYAAVETCRLRAVVLMRIAMDVQWLEKTVSRLTVGIIERNPTLCSATFSDVVKSMRENGMDINIRVFQCHDGLSDQETDALSRFVRSCNIIYVGSDMKEYYGSVLELTKGLDVLTVGDEEDFCKSNGMICLYVPKKRLRIMVNMRAVQEAGIRISSEVLRHSTIM